LQTRFYVRRSNTTYEKIIERAKMLLKPTMDPGGQKSREYHAR